MRQIYYAFQTLLRSRNSKYLKLLSLALGLLIGVLLFSQIAFELSYEDFYKDPERLVVLRYRTFKDGHTSGSYDYDVFYPAAADLREAMPDLIESASVSFGWEQPSLYQDDNKLENIRTMYADTLFFKTIGLEVLKGNPQDLAQPATVFLSESKARELFADDNPIGKTLSIDKQKEITVRGIYQDVPGNTIYPHDVVISLPTSSYYGMGAWGRNDIFIVLFRLKHAEDVEVMNQRVQKAVEQFTETKRGTDVDEYSVLPLQDVYISYDSTVRRLVILGVLGFSIFFVSVMNYVLASVASIGRRAKAVGVHKCCGANGTQVMGMFLWETGIMVLVSALFGLMLLYLFREGIEDMLGVHLADLFIWKNMWVPFLTVALLFVVAGVLPGRMYAHIPVTQVFRRYTDGKRSWKRWLLFLQFVGVSFILGVLATTISQYYDLMNRNVGFRTEGLATASCWTNENAGIEDAIRRQPYVESVTRCMGSLLEHYSTIGIFNAEGSMITSVHYQFIEKNFPETVELKLLEGSLPQHVGEALVGKKLVEVMKWQENPIGQRLPIHSQKYEGDAVVVGVVDDVRNMGFFMGQTCTAFIYVEANFPGFQVRLKEPVSDNLVRLNDFLVESYPQLSVNFRAYETIQSSMYSNVYRFRNTVWVTSCCILLIVLMGLIGYVNDETQRRSKEIAVRKVNGAEASSILKLLTKGILKIAIGAVVIGTACAWYISGIWIEQFADSELLSPIWFVALAVMVLLLIVVVVVFKSWRIANENPVKSIKSE